MQRQRQEYAGPRADHDRAGPEYRYLDWYATANMSITVQKTSKYYTTEFDLEEGF